MKNLVMSIRLVEVFDEISFVLFVESQWIDCVVSLQVFVTDLWTDHTPWPFNQLPRSYNFLVKHGSLWKMTYYVSAPKVVHQSNFAATSTFIAR